MASSASRYGRAMTLSHCVFRPRGALCPMISPPVISPWDVPVLPGSPEHKQTLATAVTFMAPTPPPNPTARPDAL